MDDPAQPLRARPPRWLALPLAAVGLGLLLFALAGLVRLSLTARPAGDHGGGPGSLLAERCRRGVPEDLAAACIEAGTRRETAALARLGVGAGLGAGLLFLAIRTGRRVRRSPHERRAD